MSDREASVTALVWYVAYGSNLSARRFSCYLGGGRPAGSLRTYEGCLDPTPARRSVPVWLQGHLRFGGASRVWGGGMAFYDRDGRGRVAARAYLVTLAQFGDVLAQESRRPAGTPYALGTAVDGRLPGLGGAYDTVLHLGEAGGAPRLALAAAQPP
ncbi:MAG TPA: histone deacetylase, partial [Phytomonospora sp.]